MKQKRNSRYLASFFLIVMAIGFFVTMPLQQYFIGRLLQGAFEAGVVGGLADWFAVTALFRHPLGIPIPHTALLPNNRKRMTEAAISMVENNWLSKESIQSKVAEVRIMKKVMEAIEKNLDSDVLRKSITGMAKRVVTQMDIHKLADVIEKEVKEKAYSIDMRTIVEIAIDKATGQKYDEKAFDYALIEVEKWIMKENTRRQLGTLALQLIDNADVEGFIKFAIKSFRNLLNEDTLGNIIYKLVTKGIDDLRSSESKNRAVLLNKVRIELENLKNNQKLISEMTVLKNSLIDKWDAKKQIISILTGIQEKLVIFIEDNKLDPYIFPLLQRLISEVKEDQDKMDQIEEWIHLQVMDFVEKNHSKIGNLVRENLDKLDNDKLVELIESNVGKDLQWIRVNGAVCGFIIGLILTIIKALL